MFCTIENALILLSGHFFLKIKTNSRIMCYLNFIYEGVFIMCKVNTGAIILANIPFHEDNPHMHYGDHYYVVLSNTACCIHSPVVHAVPLSSNCNRRLPTQVEIYCKNLPKRSFALAEQLTLLPKSALENGKLCGYIENESMEKVHSAIKIQLSLK